MPRLLTTVQDSGLTWTPASFNHMLQLFRSLRCIPAGAVATWRCRLAPDVLLLCTELGAGFRSFRLTNGCREKPTLSFFVYKHVKHAREEVLQAFYLNKRSDTSLEILCCNTSGNERAQEPARSAKMGATPEPNECRRWIFDLSQ